MTKLNSEGEKALQIAARRSAEYGSQLTEEICQTLLHHSREAQAKGHHINHNMTHSLGRAIFGKPERYSHMTPEEIAADGVAYVVNKSNSNGHHALMTACEVGSPDTVKVLLNFGANPWRVDEAGRTCVHFAARRNNGDAIIKIIVEFVKSQTSEQLISRYNREEKVSNTYLLEGNVHDIPTLSGFTPLACATLSSQVECIGVLCELGANLYTHSWLPCGHESECAECHNGSTPLHLAALRGSQSVVKCLLRCYLKQREEWNRRLQDPNSPPLPPLSSHPLIRRQQLMQREMPDLRSVKDSLGFSPHAIASWRHSHNPSVIRVLSVQNPLRAVLAEDEAGVLGPHRLTEIVSKLYRGILQERIEEIRKMPAETEMPSTSEIGEIPPFRGQKSQNGGLGGENGTWLGRRNKWLFRGPKSLTEGKEDGTWLGRRNKWIFRGPNVKKAGHGGGGEFSDIPGNISRPSPFVQAPGQTQFTSHSVLSERSLIAQGGFHYYNPPTPSLNQGASAVATALIQSRIKFRLDHPDQHLEVRAAAEMAALSHPEAVIMAAARIQRSTSRRSSTFGDGEVCCVCLDNDSDAGVVFLTIVSCNHAICIDCAEELLKHVQYKPALCPMCRGYMKSFERCLGVRGGRK